MMSEDKEKWRDQGNEPSQREQNVYPKEDIIH